MFDVAKKWTLYSRWIRRCDNPAGTNKKELCLFHFLVLFPDVSSQYSKIGKAYTGRPFENSRHLFPFDGLVYDQGRKLLSSDRREPKT